MKKIFVIISLITCLPAFLTSQNKGEMRLENTRLKGACEDQYFTGFMIELDTVYTEIDSVKLFDQLPRMGTINFKNSVQIPTEFTKTTRAGYNQIMFRFRSSWHTFDELIFNDQLITFTIDRDPKVPCTIEDLHILKLAKKILSEEKYWHKEDDRNCEDDLGNKCYSLYCALKIASVAIEGKYNHRNAVLQELRHLIVEKYPNKEWTHRLLDFNNMKETSYEDIMEILTEIELKFKMELKKRNSTRIDE